MTTRTLARWNGAWFVLIAVAAVGQLATPFAWLLLVPAGALQAVAGVVLLQNRDGIRDELARRPGAALLFSLFPSRRLGAVMQVGAGCGVALIGLAAALTT